MSLMDLVEDLDENTALKLLNRNIDEAYLESATSFDFRGKDAFKVNDLAKNYQYKVIAALQYEKIGELAKAGYCYDLASKSSFRLGFYNASKECAERSCKIYLKIEDYMNLGYSFKRADKAKKMISRKERIELKRRS